jgi:hypothetical protein
MKFPKVPTLYFPIILAGLCMGFAGSQLYLHELMGALGFGAAAAAMFLVHLHAQFINKLLIANRIMSVSMKRLMADLMEAGIVVQQVEVEGDVETFTAQLVRKDLH